MADRPGAEGIASTPPPTMAGGRPLPDQTNSGFPSPNPPRTDGVIPGAPLTVPPVSGQLPNGGAFPGQGSGVPMNLPPYTGARVPATNDATNMVAPPGSVLPRRVPPVEYPSPTGARGAAHARRPPAKRPRR